MTMMTKTQVLTQDSDLKKIDKEIDFEEITAEEEAAVEEGRKAYIKGDWKNLIQLKYELGSTGNKTGAKKS